jgi:hypothetical protein
MAHRDRKDPPERMVLTVPMVHKGRKVKKETRVMQALKEFREIQVRKGQPELMVLMVSMAQKVHKVKKETRVMQARREFREIKATRVT